MRLSLEIDNFLEYLRIEKKFSKNSLKDYSYYLNNFLNFVEIDDVLVLNNPDTVIRYQDSLQNFKKNTKNYFLIALRSFIKYLSSKKIPTINPDEINLEDHPQQQPQTVSLDSIKNLIKSIDTSRVDGLRDKIIIELFFITGLKVSELSSLDCDVLNLDNQKIKLPKSREENLGETLTSDLKNYLIMRNDYFKPLFIRFKGKIDQSPDGQKMRLSDRSIERLIEKHAKKINSDFKITPTVLRHTFATNQLQNGDSLDDLKKKLGHKNRSNLKIYTKRSISS